MPQMEDVLLNELQQECEPVQLEPFIHQVGGHSSILCLDERTVCKPLIKQELKFYESLPKSLKKFTPEYRGVVQVRFEEDQDGYIRLAAYPPKSIRHQLSSTKKRQTQKSRRIRLKNSGSIEIEIESDLNELFVDDETPSSISKAARARVHNPWVLKCHQNQLSKIRRSASHAQQKEKEAHCQKFVVLENITWRFEYPCVLDLKMGTRQYGDDASPAKIQSKCIKAETSTSVQLGVRICGMQVYQTTTGKFICRDKYFGRKLDVNGFKEGLIQFLHNGNRLRTDALIPLVEKLQDLKQVLLTLDTYRFYTSSLLLTYEGLDPEFSGDEDSFLLEVKGDINVTIPVSKSAENIGRPGGTLDQIPSSSSSIDGLNRYSSTASGSASTSSSAVTGAASASAPGAGSLNTDLGSRGSTPSARSLSDESVDVRMIDFAHATHSGFDMGHCAKEHAGPDTGYIFGLSNLLKVLHEIIDEEC